MKICVIYSGQTRSYNDNHELWNSHKRMADELKARYNIEVDFIGHTWADQPTPWNVADFLHFSQDDQNCIDDWINTDFFRRAWWNPGSDTFQDFVTECINNKTGNELLERITTNSRKAYGQIFSFFKCIEQIENTYDGYFKTRWDIMIDKTQGFTEFFPYLLEEKQDLVLFTGAAWFRPTKENFNNEATGNLFLNDTNFIMNKGAMDGYMSKNWLQDLHRVVTGSTYNDAKPSSHTLWTLMHPTNIMGRFVLQGDCFSITRTPNDVQIKKETDRWAI